MTSADSPPERSRGLAAMDPDVYRRWVRAVLFVGVIGYVTGITIGRMIGGAVLVETIFALPGLGRFTIDAVNNRDFMALQGAVVVATVGFVTVNFLVDILHGIIDPRIRTAEAVR